VVSSGTACSIRCPRSTTSRSRSCDASVDLPWSLARVTRYSLK
jgi:hypothetical protein